ncbi:MAG: glycoside hydrolase family 30 beta sandwich domain-containing protein, partial [Bacteroidota bacterium]
GHFSKYIRPGARRIAVSSNRAVLQTTGFSNPDGSVVVVVMNSGNAKLSYRLYVRDQAVEVVSLPHSIATLVF